MSYSIDLYCSINQGHMSTNTETEQGKVPPSMNGHNRQLKETSISKLIKVYVKKQYLSLCLLSKFNSNYYMKLLKFGESKIYFL